MQNFFFWLVGSFLVAIVFGSFFEWILHRFVMHRPVGRFRYAFKAHTLVHHKIFKADKTYHLEDEKDKATIPMAWWNGPVLIAIFMTPFVGVAVLCESWGVVLGALVAVCAYYGAYEYLHWCMHLPKARRLERSWIFRRLNGHHLLHHRYMNKNYNVVFPLADLCLRTLLVRSTTHFKQPSHDAVPNVQPLTPARQSQ
jgi:multisubunit Na+/H+ antiporter MnhE subunit